jgi:hypothetical protein
MSNYLNPDNSPAERAVTAKMQENPTPTRAALGSTARGAVDGTSDYAAANYCGRFSAGEKNNPCR